jgi:hypothetical protein
VILMSMSQMVRMVLARAGFVRRASAEPFDLQQTFCRMFIGVMTLSWPNQSPEPTPVGADCLPGSFQTHYVVSPAWLSFLR